MGRLGTVNKGHSSTRFYLTVGYISESHNLAIKLAQLGFLFLYVVVVLGGILLKSIVSPLVGDRDIGTPLKRQFHYKLSSK